MHVKHNNLVNLIHNELEDGFYQGLAQIFHALSINGSFHADRMCWEYIKYLYDNVTQKKSELILKSGYSKHVVKQHRDLLLNQGREKKNTKNNKPNIFKDFLQSLKDLASQYPDNAFPLYGPASFTACFNDSNLNDSSYTSKSVLEALEEAGCIRKSGQKVTFISSVPNSLKSKDDLIRQLSNLMLRYTTTQINNKDAESEDEELYEMAIASHQIPFEDQAKVLKELKSHFRLATAEGLRILERYENPRLDTARDIGFHTFLFNSNSPKRNDHEKSSDTEHRNDRRR